MMKIAICGTWHVHAPDYANTVINTEGAELIGVYEENEAWKKEFAEKFSIKAYDSFEDLLDSEADGVIVCSSSDTHADYMVKIAEANDEYIKEHTTSHSVKVEEETTAIKKEMTEMEKRIAKAKKELARRKRNK